MSSSVNMVALVVTENRTERPDACARCDSFEERRQGVERDVAVFGHVIKAAAIGDEKMPSDRAFNDSEFGLDIVHGHGPRFAGAAAARFGASFCNRSIHWRTISHWRRVRCHGLVSEPRISAGMRRSK